MTNLNLTVSRVGDLESRTEEYELSFRIREGMDHTLRVKYQAARAYEINAALDAAVETARNTIADSAPDLAKKPSDEALSQFAWRGIQSAKYEQGAPKTSTLELPP